MYFLEGGVTRCHAPISIGRCHEPHTWRLLGPRPRALNSFVSLNWIDPVPPPPLISRRWCHDAYAILPRSKRERGGKNLSSFPADGWGIISRGYTQMLIHKRTILHGWEDNVGKAQRRFGRIVQSVVDISLGRSFAKKGGTIVEMLPYRYAGGSSGWGGKEVNERIREGTRDEEKRLYNTIHANVSVVEFSFCENYLVTRAMKYERNFAPLSEDKTSESIGHRDSGGSRRLSLPSPPIPGNEMYR